MLYEWPASARMFSVPKVPFTITTSSLGDAVVMPLGIESLFASTSIIAPLSSTVIEISSES